VERSQSQHDGTYVVPLLPEKITRSLTPAISAPRSGPLIALLAGNLLPKGHGMKYTKVKIADITTPTGKDVVQVLEDRYWVVTPANEVLLYRGRIPQCNPHKSIAERIARLHDDEGCPAISGAGGVGSASPLLGVALQENRKIRRHHANHY
jgi:hypothetical protein